MEIRDAKLEDIEILKEISRQYDFEPNRDWEGLVKDHQMYMLVDEDVIGFTGLIEYKWNRTLQISNIFVKPEHRGKGLAQKLVEHLISQAEKTVNRCLIAEAPSNNSVVKLYEKTGFRKCGYNDRYYNNTGEPMAYWMSYDLE